MTNARPSSAANASRASGRSRRPSVVAIGGGDGLHRLLSGLNDAGTDICAIVTAADDGGSSGRLRKDFDIPPPGDVRRCLVALSRNDPLLGELFQYRFDDSFLKGHCFGNLFIAVLTKLTGDFRLAIDRARDLLGVEGLVIPSTDRKVVLVADHDDGTRSTGEQAIAHAGRSIVRLSLSPKPPDVSVEIRDRLAHADLICLGPGSIYTSILPNLLVPGMVAAINASRARTVFVANLLTQPGETDGFDLADHLRAFGRIVPDLEIDVVLAHAGSPAPDELERRAPPGALALPPVLGTEHAGMRLVTAPIVEMSGKVRHDPAKLAEAVLRRAGEVTGELSAT